MCCSTCHFLDCKALQVFTCLRFAIYRTCIYRTSSITGKWNEAATGLRSEVGAFVVHSSSLVWMFSWCHYRNGDGTGSASLSMSTTTEMCPILITTDWLYNFPVEICCLLKFSYMSDIDMHLLLFWTTSVCFSWLSAGIFIFICMYVCFFTFCATAFHVAHNSVAYTSVTCY